MTGMTTTGTTSLSSYSNRTIAIAVSGHCTPNTSRQSDYVIKVPYSRLSATMQSIGRSGANITRVTLNGQPAPSQPQPIESVSESPAVISPTVPSSPASAPIATPVARPATKPTVHPVAHGHGFQPQSDPKKSKKRKR